MLQGIVLCSLGVLTFGLGLKQFWDMKKDKPVQEETPAVPAPHKDEVIDTTAVAE